MLSPVSGPDGFVLCYHALSATWTAALSTTVQRFELQVRGLLTRGYEPMRFSDAVLNPPQGKWFAVTFDDAFRSVFELGWPVLRRSGIPATMFVPTDYIDRGPLRWPGVDHWLDGPHAGEMTAMSWDQLRALADDDWEIGSHTGSHPHLTELSDESLADELARSKRECERRLERPCTSIAYPYGDVDERVVRAAANAGYAAAAAMSDRLDQRGPLEYPRIGVCYADDNLRFRLKISSPVRLARRTVLWDALRRVRPLA
jgi:peptidoglycan/xylan/chitin deacetylase (PgdA/CDA1 family)